MTLDELKMVRDSLQECTHDVEYFSWGPSLAFAQKRREVALKILKREIRKLKEEKNVRNQ